MRRGSEEGVRRGDDMRIPHPPLTPTPSPHRVLLPIGNKPPEFQPSRRRLQYRGGPADPAPRWVGLPAGLGGIGGAARCCRDDPGPSHSVNHDDHTRPRRTSVLAHLTISSPSPTPNRGGHAHG